MEKFLGNILIGDFICFNKDCNQETMTPKTVMENKIIKYRMGNYDPNLIVNSGIEGETRRVFRTTHELDFWSKKLMPCCPKCGELLVYDEAT